MLERARAAAAPTMRVLWAARHAAVRAVRRVAALPPAAVVCPLRSADGVAGRPLPRVRGAAARLRPCAGGGGLRRRRARGRRGVEGAGPPPPGDDRRGRDRGACPEPGGSARAGPARPRPRAEAAPASRWSPGGRARDPVGRPVARPPRTAARVPAPAGTAARRAQKERPRGVRGEARAAAGGGRRRRLHQRRDGECGRFRAAARRCEASGHRHVRASRPGVLQCEDGFTDAQGRTRCDFR